MTTKVIVKQLAAEEDLLLGEGQTTQTRNGQSVPVTKINLFKIVHSNAELQALDTAKFKYATLVAQGYSYDYYFDGATWRPLGTLGALDPVVVPWTSVAGGTLTQPNQAFLHPTDGNYYSWAGEYPKVVAPGTDPAAVGSGYVPRQDAVLRQDLANPALGASLIAFSEESEHPEGTVAAALAETRRWTVANDSADYRARNIFALATVTASIRSRAPLSVLFQGDSMTAGYDVNTSDSVPPREGDWARHATNTVPSVFKHYLTEQSGCSVSTVIRAISGHTAKQAYDEPAWQGNPDADLVFLNYGINDTSKGTLNEYLSYMEKLIRRFIDWGVGVVVVLPYGGLAGSSTYRTWAEQAKTIASIYGCGFFDGQEATAGTVIETSLSDYLHYNSVGYATVATQMASMLMAGGLMQTYKPLTNETQLRVGLQTQSVGFCNAAGTSNPAHRYSTAYGRSQVTGRFLAGERTVVSFSFYLDAEAAHVSVNAGLTSDVPSGIQYHFGAPSIYTTNDEDNLHYQLAGRQPAAYTSPLTRRGGFALPSVSLNSPVYIGRIIGRGWHTITFFRFKPQATVDAYLQLLTISPVPVEQSVEGDAEGIVIRGSHLKVPSPVGSTEIPPPVTLESFQIRDSGIVADGVAAISKQWWRKRPSTLRIIRLSLTEPQYADYLVSGGVGTDVSATLVSSNFPTPPELSITRKSRDVRVMYASGEFGTSAPHGNVLDTDPALGTSQGRGGVYLEVSLDWGDGGPLTGYWDITLTAPDYPGVPGNAVRRV